MQLLRVTVFLTVVLAAFACKKPVVDIMQPPNLSNLKWGQGIDSAVRSFTGLGWQVLRKTPESLDLGVSPMDAEQLKEELLEDMPIPYRLTLFFHADRLTVARFLRRDTGTNTGKFFENIKNSYGLSAPVWTGDRKREDSPTGNIRYEQEMIFEKPDVYIKIFRNEVKMKEDQLNSIAGDELEISIFSRVENPGISVDGLKEP